jgi:catechol 2,3-dioxygenase-like lactoylglutathione lyase family enzyme
MSSPFATPVQIAYPVDDVVTAAEAFSARTGAGPFFVLRHIPLAESRVHGSPAPFDHSSAYGQWGTVMVELVQEHTPALVAPGSGLHHVAFMVPDLVAAMRQGAQQGWHEVLWAATATGQQFAFASAPELGHLVEMYEPSQRLLGFYARIADAARGWDGSDPVRLLN